MKSFPDVFASRSQFDGYLSCLSKLSLGDELDLYTNPNLDICSYKTDHTLRATVIGLSKKGQSSYSYLQRVVLLLGIKNDMVGWKLNCSPFDMDYTLVFPNWKSFPRAWHYQLSGNELKLTNGLVAKVHRV